jgi:hypothetical protein
MVAPCCFVLLLLLSPRSAQVCVRVGKGLCGVNSLCAQDAGDIGGVRDGEEPPDTIRDIDGTFVV